MIKGLKNTKWTDDELELLKLNYPTMGYGVMALFPGKTKNQVQWTKSTFNLHMTKEFKDAWKSKLKEKSKYKVNSDLFTNRETLTPLAAYILGLLWADGHVKKLKADQRKRYGITLATTLPDGGYFKDVLALVGKWNPHFSKNHLKHPTYRPELYLTTHNPYFHLFLSEHGYTDKVNPQQILDFIPVNLKQFWLLGLIDGDGSWSHNQNKPLQPRLGISGPYEANWSPIHEYLTSIGCFHSTSSQFIDKKGNKSSSLQLRRYDECITVGRLMYHNRDLSNLGLLRKYEKWLTSKQSKELKAG